jgi:hypothetical protein
MGITSQSQDSSSARSWSWAERSLTQPDNPVKRWLRRPRENRLQEKHRAQHLRRLIVRPAI